MKHSLYWSIDMVNTIKPYNKVTKQNSKQLGRKKKTNKQTKQNKNAFVYSCAKYIIYSNIFRLFCTEHSILVINRVKKKRQMHTNVYELIQLNNYRFAWLRFCLQLGSRSSTVRLADQRFRWVQLPLRIPTYVPFFLVAIQPDREFWHKLRPFHVYVAESIRKTNHSIH